VGTNVGISIEIMVGGIGKIKMKTGEIGKLKNIGT